MSQQTTGKEEKGRFGPGDVVFCAVIIHYRLAICGLAFGATILLMPSILRFGTVTLPQIVITPLDWLNIIALIAAIPGIILLGIFLAIYTWPIFPSTEPELETTVRKKGGEP